MASTKFYAIQSDNEDEVKFLLGLTSILQFDFNHDAELFIQTSGNIEPLVNLFNWKKKPSIGLRGIYPDETYLNLWGKEVPVNSSKSILSSEFQVSGNVQYVPKHLLNSQIKSDPILISQCWTVARVIHENKFSIAAPSRKLSFVYSSDVKEWISLLEANDALIARWYRERDDKTDLTLVDVSRGILPDVVGKTAFSSDTVIISKISLSTTQFIKSVRSINPDIKLILHAFESPSVYFANTFLYDLKDYLYENDLWLMSCEADKKLAEESFHKINSQVFPLKKPDIFLNTKQSSSLKHLLYFGRISEQKNLHEAIIAVSLIADEMRKHDRKFKIFGYEDFLGLPHLRIPSLGYLEMLYKLAKNLGISDLVEFHPAIPQSKIDEHLKEGVFLSVSFHSDENFGLVAHRALNLGIPVVLSDFDNQPRESFEHSANISASVQAYFEKTFLKLCTELKGKHPGFDNLILVGGCALNCLTNSRLVKEKYFKNVFIPPFPNDEGISMGAALCLAHRQGKIQFRTLPFEKMHAYMGRNKSGEVTLDQIKEAFPDYKIRPWQDSSQILADGEVVAIFQGPSEVGPRALGNRTLMVRPDRKEVKKYLNENIKFREEFRPYGATVLQEDVHVYFDVDKGFIAPFMTFAPLIRKEKESYLTGVTHKDMTSRIQTISREQNQRYYDIIKGFKSITGESVILNTSLNIMGQPILEDLSDAKSFMKDSKVRYMVINDYLLEKL